MKLKDAERSAKATAAFLERLKAARAKLETAKGRALAAAESLATANEDLSEAFLRWQEKMEELDPEDELEASTDDSHVLLQLDELTEAIETAFGEQSALLDIADEFFEELLARAKEYEEPEEEEEDEDDETEYVFTCDHPGCKESTDFNMTQAREAGWEIWSEPAPRGKTKWTSFCPKHRR